MPGVVYCLDFTGLEESATLGIDTSTELGSRETVQNALPFLIAQIQPSGNQSDKL